MTEYDFISCEMLYKSRTTKITRIFSLEHNKYKTMQPLQDLFNKLIRYFAKLKKSLSDSIKIFQINLIYKYITTENTFLNKILKYSGSILN